MSRPRQAAIALLLSGFMPTAGAAAFLPGDEAAGTLRVEVNRSGRIQVQAKGVPVAAVLDEVAKKTEIPIRYSDAPVQAVTVDCSGSSLKDILLCVLGAKADLLLAGGKAPNSSVNRPEWREVRILASTFWKQSEPRVPEPSESQDNLPSPVPGRVASEDSAVDLEGLLASTHSPNPEVRAQGLNQLANSGLADAATLNAAIQAGLADRDGEVRAEALSSSMRLRLPDSPRLVEQGLQDEDAAVRLAAVDNLRSDERGRQLLQERLADEDPAVRSLAEIKLSNLP